LDRLPAIPGFSDRRFPHDVYPRAGVAIDKAPSSYHCALRPS
jgi:hypothetical protein